MSEISINQCVEDFLRITTQGPTPSISQLVCALDKLAVAYHEGTNIGFVENEAEPPKSDYKMQRAQLSQRFPDFGYYDVSDPMTVASHEELIGDAIDDLTDIVRDLQDVNWRFKNVSANDATWHFCNLYEIHWGRHLRELALYLHARQF